MKTGKMIKTKLVGSEPKSSELFLGLKGKRGRINFKNSVLGVKKNGALGREENKNV